MSSNNPSTDWQSDYFGRSIDERLKVDASKSLPSRLSSVLTAQSVFAATSSQATLPALFISHGAPTLAIEQSTTTKALARLGQNLPTPKAIIIMSAHWLSPQLELSGHPKPATWHDFSGFDEALY